MHLRHVAGATLAGLGLTLAAQGHSSPIPQGSQWMRLDSFVTIPSGQGVAMDLTYAPDGSGRVFIGARNGFVRVVDSGGTMQTTPFLDMAARGVTVSTGGERGLLGLAFHPDFAVSGAPGFGKFYTHTSEPRTGTADFNHPELIPGNLGDHHAVIREWTVDPASPNQVLSPSRELMRINQPASNHNGGAIVFGADTNLYIALGDGGGARDGLPGNSNTDGHTNNTGNAQDTSNVYGSILRIDPLGNNSANSKYGVPASNPFVGQSGVDEIYAYGLRNPWKISFDRQAGDLYAADVGQSHREEVNIIAIGGNYGWVYREGSIATPGIGVTPPPGAGPFIDPVAEYVNRAQPGGDGNSVIGGFVYRGSLIPQLRGKYVFGDLAGFATTGRLFYTNAGGGQIFEFQLEAGSAAVPGMLFGFGEDEIGELYAYFAGQVFRLSASPALIGDANLDGRVDIADLSILAGNWQQTGRFWEHGDFDGSGIVNIADLSLLASNWQAGVPAGEATISFAEAMAMFDVFNGVVIPEPTSLSLLSLAGLSLLRRRGPVRC